jgi:cyclopropane-fatty-acyl-phospholipid synthase
MKTTDLSAPGAAISNLTLKSSGGLYQRLTLRALARMPCGQLHLELPDGTTHRLGQADRARWHAGTRATAALAIPETATLKVLRPAFFEKCVLHGDIGFAEAFIDGDWATPDLAAVIAWFVLNVEKSPTLSGSRAKTLGLNLLRAANRLAHLWRPNSLGNAVRNIREHYDLSNDFFRLWLDPSMMYSSARWERPDLTLEEAQAAKNESLCRKLQLSAGDHVLEIGSGWGGWSLYAVKHYGCRVTTLTLSREQHELARQRIAAAGLSERIEVRLQDYRDLPAGERFDKLVSIEMLEAVGHRYLEDWCRVAARALKPDGLMALQFISCPDARYEEIRRGVDFIQKHIFPGGLILSVNRLNDLLASTGGFVLQGLEDLGQDYARTLRAWREAFNGRLAAVQALGFDESFVRKWNYYFAYCEAAFALRNVSVVQTVHTRPNNLSYS